jgi:trans-aconitate methyltransferase
MVDIRRHWEQVYESKTADAVSWFQARPNTSLAFIADSELSPDAPIIDVGGGASTLIDHLLDLGYANLSVLDISAHALAQAKARLGAARARRVHWLVQDVTRFVPPQPYALWHDRAVFHFLTDEAARSAYLTALRRSVAPGGTVIVATFAADGTNTMQRPASVALRRQHVECAIWQRVRAHRDRARHARDAMGLDPGLHLSAPAPA